MTDMYCPRTGEFNCIRHACECYFDEPLMKGCYYHPPDNIYYDEEGE